MKRTPFLIIGILIIFLYLFLRLGWLETVEFGYDQPKLATGVIDFIKNPTFINSYNYVTTNAFGLASWGPLEIFFYSPFVLISQHPLTISIMVSIFNLASIIIIFYIGYKFFSIRVGIIAGLVLTVHPWWFIFSRMIYSPVPSVVLATISLYLLFSFIKNPSKINILFLVLSLGILMQIYYMALFFVLFCFLFIILNYKRHLLPSFLLGCFLTLILYLPIVKIIFQGELFGVVGSVVKIPSSQFVLLPELTSLIKGSINIFAGTGFEWQLGYSYREFVSNNSFYNVYSYVSLMLILFVFIYNLLIVLKRGPNYYFRLILLMLTLSTPFFLCVLKGFRFYGINPLPRYFLFNLPTLSLLLGIMLDDITRNKKFGKIRRALSFLIWNLTFSVLILWVVLIVKYNNFVISYDYPNGYLSTNSDIPYSFLEKSIDWTIQDANSKGFGKISISNDPNKPRKPALNWATLYLLENVYKDKLDIGGGSSTAYYVIQYSPVPTNININYQQFGPYVVYNYSVE